MIGGGYEGTENAPLLGEDLELVPAQLDGHHIGQDSGCHLEVNTWRGDLLSGKGAASLCLKLQGAAC